MSLNPARGILLGIGLGVLLVWLPLGYMFCQHVETRQP